MIRHEKNPLITPDMVKPTTPDLEVMGAFNAGATMLGDETILLLRVSERCRAEPGYVAEPVYRFEEAGSRLEILRFRADDPDVLLKDTRGVVYKGIYYLSTLSTIRVARSPDGIIFYPPDKDVNLFPEKINGRYWALHRPHNEGFGKPSIWISSSPNLLEWGQHYCLIRPRENEWERIKIGGGAAPIRTDRGWLEVYHSKGDSSKYYLFILLLDLEDPTQVIARGSKPFLTPETDYEVFPERRFFQRVD